MKTANLKTVSTKPAAAKSVSAKPAITVSEDPSIRILKTATCPSLSGQSKLTYNIACNLDSQIQFRVIGNSSSGFFSKEWISAISIQKLLDKAPKGTPITSVTFFPLFRGKSVNSSGFLLAVLMQEGLVQPMADKKRCYERVESEAFVSEITALMDAALAGTTDGKSKPVAPAKKAIQKGASKRAVTDHAS